MKKTQKLKKCILTILIWISTLMYSMPVQAGSLESSKLVTGSKNLLTDGLKVLIGITALVTTVLFAWRMFQFNQADEEVKPKHKKAAKTTLIAGVIILLSETIITVVFSYYQ